MLKDRIVDSHKEAYLQDILISVEELRHRSKDYKASNTTNPKFRSAIRKILGLE